MKRREAVWYDSNYDELIVEPHLGGKFYAKARIDYSKPSGFIVILYEFIGWL